jgi:molybdenum cofactor guanylyltransferase
MGRDKATLALLGEPLWSRQLAVLRELKPAMIWISAREAPSWAPPDVEVVLDDIPSRGPLTGITAGLNRVRTSYLLALAVDLPRMTSDHLLKLAAFAVPKRGVIPRNHDKFEPLSAIYPQEAAPLAQQALTSSDVSMQSFVRKLLDRRLLLEYPLATEEIDLYQNLNTPHDLQP